MGAGVLFSRVSVFVDGGGRTRLDIYVDRRTQDIVNVQCILDKEPLFFDHTPSSKSSCSWKAIDVHFSQLASAELDGHHDLNPYSSYALYVEEKY
ncbi:unnamed protein product [Calypogeia fissa]